MNAILAFSAECPAEALAIATTCLTAHCWLRAPQGDIGDSFYVILSGEAEVLRDEHPGEEVPETVLARLGKFDFFGERALLKREPRYAAVRATSDLVTMALTQADCEKALGRPLIEIVPDLH